MLIFNSWNISSVIDILIGYSILLWNQANGHDSQYVIEYIYSAKACGADN